MLPLSRLPAHDSDDQTAILHTVNRLILTRKRKAALDASLDAIAEAPGFRGLLERKACLGDADAAATKRFDHSLRGEWLGVHPDAGGIINSCGDGRR